MTCKQFYDRFSTDRFSVVKCPHEIETMRMCLDMYRQSDDQC